MTFEAMYERYHAEVLRCAETYGPRDDAEDAQQETFLNAWKAWDRFDGKNAGAWLQVICRRVCFNRSRTYRRRAARYQHLSISDYTVNTGPHYDMAVLLDARAELEALKPVMVRLTGIQQAALRRACRGDEIGAAKGALQRARRELREARER